MPRPDNFQVVVQSDTSTSILLMKRGRSLVTRRCFGLAADSQQQATPGTQAGGGSTAAGQPHDSSSSHGGDDDDDEDVPKGRLVAAVFDPQRAFRLFGVTDIGELVSLVVPSGVAAHQCRVSSAVTG